MKYIILINKENRNDGVEGVVQWQSMYEVLRLIISIVKREERKERGIEMDGMSGVEYFEVLVVIDFIQFEVGAVYIFVCGFMGY